MDPNASPTVRIKYPANLRVGYCQIPAGEFDPSVHELWVDPLDHDKDGKPGGSEPQGNISDELEKLREDAKALGIKVHWKHSAETIQAAIDAKLGE